MTKLDKLKLLYTQLGLNDRIELKKFINDFETNTYSDQEQIRESLNDVLNKSLGPINSSGCILCGK